MFEMTMAASWWLYIDYWLADMLVPCMMLSCCVHCISAAELQFFGSLDVE